MFGNPLPFLPLPYVEFMTCASPNVPLRIQLHRCSEFLCPRLYGNSNQDVSFLLGVLSGGELQFHCSHWHLNDRLSVLQIHVLCCSAENVEETKSLSFQLAPLEVLPPRSGRISCYLVIYMFKTLSSTFLERKGASSTGGKRLLLPSPLPLFKFKYRELLP